MAKKNIPLQPENFELETNTVWAFPERGKWATHDAKYRGNWSPYIPRNVILRDSKEGDTVLDQFVGGGTTAVEANFYSSQGSKLNETARSYKTIALEAKEIDGFAFVWFTDGQGWKSARHNLEETFDVLDNMYCITDMENGIVKELFK